MSNCLPRALMCAAALLTVITSATGGQRLVGAGDDWSRLEILPGDEIVLMPGVHRPAAIKGLSGTPKRPIVIRSLSVDRGAVIEADRWGIQLQGVKHLIIKDLTIRGARFGGISVRPPSDHAGDQRWPTNLRIRNVAIEETGPVGQRHAVHLDSVESVKIQSCRFEGWGGAAIDVLNCRDVEISTCLMRGAEHCTQQAGIHVHGGSEMVRIFDSTMEQAGKVGVFMGGEVEGLERDPANGQFVEARDVRVMRCVIRDAACPIRFLGADRCSARNLTIIRPRQWVLTVDNAPSDARRAPSTDIRFGSNLVVWEPGDLSGIVKTGNAYRAGGIQFDANLWWSPDASATAMLKLPEDPAAPQVLDVDPAPDAEYRPTVAQASLFGAHAP